jgi:hypothetical protein
MRIVSLFAAGLLCAATAAAAQTTIPAEPRVARSTFPKSDFGKPIPQLGVESWNYWNLEEAFVDHTKNYGVQWRANFADRPSMDIKALWQAGYIDKTTLYPRQFPPGAVTISGGVFRGPAPARPQAFADTYVLDWAGDADIRLYWRDCANAQDVNCQRAISANRVEATFDASYVDPVFWYITRLGPQGVSSIRIYRKGNEAAVNAGKILNPKFSDLARRYKIIRFANPQHATDARPFRAGDFVAPDAATLVPDYWPGIPDAPKAINFETLFRISAETSTAAWVHVAGLPGLPPSFDALMEPGADANQWRSQCRANYQTILNSLDWAHYMDAIVRGLKRANYPRNRTLYLEGWNEVWNVAWPWVFNTFCAEGFADALGATPPFYAKGSYGYGYLSAHAMVAFDAALRRGGRSQAWTLALAQYQVVPGMGAAALEGFKRYFTDRGADPAPWLKNVGLAVTSYYLSSLDRTTGFLKAPSDEAHRDLLRSRILADPEGTARARADWIINATDYATIPWEMDRWRTIMQMAADNGAGFLGDYEGESFDFMPQYFRSDPLIVNWSEDFTYGPQGERVTRAWAQAIAAMGPNLIASNYKSVGNVDPEGNSPTDAALAEPFIDAYYGEVNGRTRGLDFMLRP